MSPMVGAACAIALGLLGVSGGLRAYRGTWTSWTRDLMGRVFPYLGIGFLWIGLGLVLLGAGAIAAELLPRLSPNIPGIVLMGLGIVVLWFGIIGAFRGFPGSLTPTWLREYHAARRLRESSDTRWG